MSLPEQDGHQKIDCIRTNSRLSIISHIYEANKVYDILLSSLEKREGSFMTALSKW